MRTSQLGTGVLSYEENYITEQFKRANILRDFQIARHHAIDDLPSFSFSGNTHIPWVVELDENEVRACTMGSGNTYPVANRISVQLLTAY